MEVAVTGKAKLKLAWASLLFRSNVLAMEEKTVKLLEALIWKKSLVNRGPMRNKWQNNNFRRIKGGAGMSC